MLGQVGVRVAQAAQVNDALDAGCRRRPGEILGCLHVALAEFVVAAHAVNQVVGYRHAVHGFGQVVGTQHIADGDIDVIAPRSAAQTLGPAAHQNPHPVALGQQPGHQATANVAGYAGD